jgi:predicted phage tail protein
MKEITLHGELAEKFGSEPFMLDANTPQMLTRGMICRFGNEFKKIIRAGTFEFLCLKDGKKEYIHDEMTAQKVIDADEIHLTPVVAGAGRFGQIIIGIILIVVGVLFAPWSGGGTSPLVGIGIAMVAGGVVQLLTPVPNVNALSGERPDSKPSFIFNGAVNVYEQGGPVPLVYGRFKAGSVIVSAGFDVERIAYNVRCGRRYDAGTGDCTRGPRRPNR